MELIDLIIVGAGPSGINVGVEAQRIGLRYIIIEKGVLVNSIFHFPANMTFFSTSKNIEIAEIPFISHSDKPTRREALEYYRRIIEFYTLNIKYREEVLSADKNDEIFVVKTTRNNYRSRYLVVATGFYDKPRRLDVPGEDLPKVKHYYDEAHPYIGQKILVIGAANSACDVALETWQKGATVTMAIREATLYEKVKYWILPNIENRIQEGSIKAYFNTTVTAITPTQVDLVTPTGNLTIDNDFVLAMTGYMPDYDLLNRLNVPIGTDVNKTPICNKDTLETAVEGLYIAGVVNAGMATNKLFIENTRHHGARIIGDILKKE